MKNLFISYLLYLLFLGFTEKSDFQWRGGEGSRKGNVQWGIAEKRGGLGQFVDLRKEGGRFLRGGLMPQRTLCCHRFLRQLKRLKRQYLHCNCKRKCQSNIFLVEVLFCKGYHASNLFCCIEAPPQTYFRDLPKFSKTTSQIKFAFDWDLQIFK